MANDHDIDPEQSNIILTPPVPLVPLVPLAPRRPLWAWQMVARLLDSFRRERERGRGRAASL